MRVRRHIISAVLLITIILTVISQVQTQPHPGYDGDGSGTGGDPIGGGASIGGGVAVLITLGMGYAAKKLYHSRKKLDE